MHRASLVEIIVPYGDPRLPFDKKCAYDVVDYGLGFSSSSLELGCDCLGHIQYFDAVLNNSKGERICQGAVGVGVFEKGTVMVRSLVAALKWLTLLTC